MTILILISTFSMLAWLVAKDPNPTRTLIALGSFVMDLVVVGGML